MFSCPNTANPGSIMSYRSLTICKWYSMTGYRLLFTASIICLGVPKITLSEQGNAILSNELDLVLGVVLVIM